MIDDKKIDIAATYYAEENPMDIEDQMGDIITGTEELSKAYKAGAKWAFNEFRKDLWHPASEEPVEDKPFLAQEIGRWRVSVNSPLIPNNEWSTQRKIRGIKRWLYVEDLLPKTQKGGNHD